jgi:hypothetical protein
VSKARTNHTIESLKARTIEEGDCWLWQGYIVNSTPQVIGYPDGKKKMVSVRRMLRELVTGQKQPDGHFGNTCGNHQCVNPDHAIWRGQDAHMRAMAKTRTVSTVTAHKLRQHRINAGFAKLDESKAQEIRMSSEPAPVLAERFGVSKSAISRIRRNEVWRILTSPWQGLFK